MCVCVVIGPQPWRVLRLLLTYVVMQLLTPLMEYLNLRIDPTLGLWANNFIADSLPHLQSKTQNILTTTSLSNIVCLEKCSGPEGGQGSVSLDEPEHKAVSTTPEDTSEHIPLKIRTLQSKFHSKPPLLNPNGPMRELFPADGN